MSCHMCAKYFRTNYTTNDPTPSCTAGCGVVDVLRDNALRDAAHSRRLRSLGTLSDFKLHRLPFLQRFEPIASDRGIMDEYVLGAIIGGDKSVPLLITKPLHRATCHTYFTPFWLQKHKKTVQQPLLAA